MNAYDIGWLAGTWDGEGSIGMVLDRGTYILQAQLTTTCKRTVDHLAALLREMGVSCRVYCYEEKLEHHKPSWHLHVSRQRAHVRRLGAAIEPYSVTKQEAWRDAIKWIDQREARCGNRRGIAYSDEDIALAERIRERSRRPIPASS